VLEEQILSNSNAVRTLVHSSVRSAISNISPDLDSVTPFKTDIVKWLSPVIDLSNFHVYPMNGITQGLDWWMAKEHRNIYMDDGDYQWVIPSSNMYDSPIKYISSPSSIDGNFRQVTTDNPVALDLAYVGSTRVEKIHVPENVEYVFYSLSKAFGIRNVRTGWLFTKSTDMRLEALINSAKYYNYYANQVAETIISNFDIDFVHKMYYNEQIRICSELDVIPSDSVWIATTTNEKYKKFRRAGNLARLCLAGVYNE